MPERRRRRDAGHAPSCAWSTGACWPTAGALGPKSSTVHFEAICEGCGFFNTGPEFLPILRSRNPTMPRRTAKPGGRTSTTASSPKLRRRASDRLADW